MTDCAIAKIGQTSLTGISVNFSYPKVVIQKPVKLVIQPQAYSESVSFCCGVFI